MADKPEPRSTFQSTLMLNDKVSIDGFPELGAVVTGFSFRMERSPLVECSYFHDGEQKTLWIEEWRLVRRNV